MSLFDFFVSSDKKPVKTKGRQQPQQQQQAFNYTNAQSDSAKSSAMNVFFPKSFDDVSTIIEVLSMGKPAVVNIKDCREISTQRVIDILSGAIFALHGGVCTLDDGVYLFSLNGVTVQ